MHLIISSFSLHHKNFFLNMNGLQYKFLVFDDLIKKINKKYLFSCKIIFLTENEKNPKIDSMKEEKTKINSMIHLIKNYNEMIHLYILNISDFHICESSLFFINEFTNQKIDLNQLNSLFSNVHSNHSNVTNTFKLPQIIMNNHFNLNVVICGVCRNISEFIFNSFHKFIYLTYYFKHSKIIIYENDSNDNTLEKLNFFKNLFSSFNIEIIILTEKNIQGSITQRIAHGRNYILDYIYIHQLNPDYLMFMDMDDVLIQFKCDSIMKPFKSNFEWSMLGANSLIYYDMWALRTMNKPNEDFWIGKKENNKYIVPKDKILESYFIVISESKPIPVLSCFNGIGIYKYKHIVDCKYDGSTTCEHVSFHQQMIEKYDAKLFIFPNLMVGPHKILGKNMDTYNTKNFKLVKNKL